MMELTKNLITSQNISKLLFRLLLVCLPLNLGLHFIIPQAYVGGLLIDYLVPVIFVQDLIALSLVIWWFVTTRDIKKVNFNYLLLVTFTLFTIFLTTLIAPRFDTAFHVFLRWALYALVSLYVAQKVDVKQEFGFFAKTLCIWIIFLGVLAAGQFIKQGAVFNNYLVLGEQPYSISTPLIDKENVFGYARVPAYGIFRHPNIFGGYLAVTLVLVLYSYKTKFIKAKLYFGAQTFGIIGLFLTFSYFSWAGYIIGVVLLLVENKRALKKLLIANVLALVIAGLFITKIQFTQDLVTNPSVYKRVELLQAGYEMLVTRHYLFGVGINQSTVAIERFMIPNGFIRFVQPPHNIFVLLASEAGLLTLMFFSAILGYALYRAYYVNYVLFVALVQVIFLSSFDHYFLTIHQPFLLLWIILGLAFA